MPYKIETNKNGSFSVVNKESKKRLSKGTTKEKANKQIQSVYAHGGGSLKPNHAVRYFTTLLKDRMIKNPLHRKILEFSKEALKREEMRGAGFWDDLWGGIKNSLALPAQVIQEVPFVREVLSFAFPEAKEVLKLVPQFTKYIYGDDTNLWLTDLLGDFNQDKKYKSSDDLKKNKKGSQEAEVYNYNDDYTNYNQYDNMVSNSVLLNLENARKQKAMTEQEKLDAQKMSIYGENERYTEKLARELEHIDQITPQASDTPYEPYAVPVFNPVSYDKEGKVIPLDNALRFPMVYNFSNTDQPKNLQEYLLSCGVAGKDFSIREFGNVVTNQRPYAFLDYPINGGSIKKIDYSKNCF